jgi:hypothetical protein
MFVHADDAVQDSLLSLGLSVLALRLGGTFPRSRAIRSLMHYDTIFSDAHRLVATLLTPSLI